MRELIPVVRLYTDDQRTLLARDGVIICFFMRRSHGEVAPAIWRTLQTYRQAIPPQSLAWTFDSEGDPVPLDDKAWESIRAEVLECPWSASCKVGLRELPSDVGGYNFEYEGRWLDAPLFAGNEGATCAVSFSLPTEYLLEHGPAHVRTLALELARELPFSFGYASLAFVSPSGLWYAARQTLLPLLTRYLGMDLYYLYETSRVIGTGARGAYWLTFLGKPLLDQLGGTEGLHERLHFPEVSFQPLGGERLLLTLGEWPDPIDMQQPRQLHLPYLLTLADQLKPFIRDENIGLTSLLDKENMGRWLRRLCQ